jgi:hypothetical protein
MNKKDEKCTSTPTPREKRRWGGRRLAKEMTEKAAPAG